MRTSLRYRVLIHVAAALVSVAILAPFVWMVVASLSSQGDLTARPYHWLPSDWTFSRYRDIAAGHGDNVAGAFRESVLNSLIVASGTVVISMAVGIFGSYAFAMLRFRFRRITLVMFLVTYMLPPIALLV